MCACMRGLVQHCNVSVRPSLDPTGSLCAVPERQAQAVVPSTADSLCLFPLPLLLLFLALLLVPQDLPAPARGRLHGRVPHAHLVLRAQPASGRLAQAGVQSRACNARLTKGARPTPRGLGAWPHRAAQSPKACLRAAAAAVRSRFPRQRTRSSAVSCDGRGTRAGYAPTSGRWGFPVGTAAFCLSAASAPPPEVCILRAAASTLEIAMRYRSSWFTLIGSRSTVSHRGESLLPFAAAHQFPSFVSCPRLTLSSACSIVLKSFTRRSRARFSSMPPRRE